MVHLYPANDPEFCRISTDSAALSKWILKSPSRKYNRLERRWDYPIQELQDVYDVAAKLHETVQMDPVVEAAYAKFQAKLAIVHQLKGGVETEYKITKPEVFKQDIPEKYYYQYPVIAQMIIMQKCLLVLDVGMGKTIVTLYALSKLREMLGGRFLVVCESNQIHKPWLDTILKFTTIQDYLIIEGTPVERLRKIEYGKQHPEKWLWIASYDTIKIESGNIPHTWVGIAKDEVTKVKNVSTDAFKALDILESTYTFGLSATPVMNTYFDLYGVMKMVNANVFTNKTNYADRYLKLNYFGNPVGVQTGMETELQRKIYPWTVQLCKGDKSEIIPRKLITYPTPLTELQQKELTRIQNEIAVGDRTAFESGTALRQICNTIAILSETVPRLDEMGNPMVDKKGKVKKLSRLLYPDVDIKASTNKIDTLKELIEDTVVKRDKKVVVFSFFKSAIKLLQQELSEYETKVVTGDSLRGCKYPNIEMCDKCPKYRYCKTIKKEIFDFVEGDVPILLGTDSLSRAHNLYTCDTIINFDLPWSSADLEQRIGRIDRSNNEAEELFIYNIVTLGTIEERIIKIIENKEKESSKVFPKYNVVLSKLSSTIKVKEG